MDSTHGTNYYRFPLFTILVVDAHGNGIPVAWFFCTTENADCIAQFLDAFKKRVRDLSHIEFATFSDEKCNWNFDIFTHLHRSRPRSQTGSPHTLSAADAELLAVELVFGWEMRAFICHWHAQRAWQKQLAAKVPCCIVPS